MLGRRQCREGAASLAGPFDATSEESDNPSWKLCSWTQRQREEDEGTGQSRQAQCSEPLKEAAPEAAASLQAAPFSLFGWARATLLTGGSRPPLWEEGSQVPLGSALQEAG